MTASHKVHSHGTDQCYNHHGTQYGHSQFADVATIGGDDHNIATIIIDWQQLWEFAVIAKIGGTALDIE